MKRTVRPRPPLLRALGANDPPPRIEIDGHTYHWVETFKHDSWAATAKYAGEPGEVVCKFNRVQPVLSIPMTWLGRRLARREARALAKLADVPGIPELCGPVKVDGHRRENAVAHAFVPGHPIASREWLNDDFFPDLVNILRAVHERGIAYVDLHKRENIIVGDDDSPYLVDFQVCYCLWYPRLQKNFILRWILQALQRMDLYHLAKHIKNHRPDQVDLFIDPVDAMRPAWIDVHRKIAAPLRKLRRAVLVYLGVRARGGRALTESFAEDAVRREKTLKQAA